MSQRIYSFSERKQMSEGTYDSLDVPLILLRCIPHAARVEKANDADDRHGTDYWVYLVSGHVLSVDVKVREKDFGKDDYALEVWSVVGKKIGWTRDEDKRTDYILWIWPTTHRYSCVPFHLLCVAMNRKWREWCKEYQTNIQRTNNLDGTLYKSGCVYVPRKVVWDEMCTASTGRYL